MSTVNGPRSAFLGQRSTVFRRLLLWILAASLPATAFAQEVDVDVRGGFFADSIKIGEQTGYYLSARYPSEMNVLFPDSIHDFTPFEYDSKEYFFTRTTDGISTDSTIYYLTTFEIDRVLHLSLPVYVVHGRDCTVVTTVPDSVLITQFVAHVPDTVSVAELPFKENTAYEDVRYDFNVGLLLGLLTVLLALALIGWGMFGRRIVRHFKVKKMKKDHMAFLNRYNALLSQLNSGFSSLTTESALVAWKKYMEQLESKPYTKLTTRETQRLVREPGLIGDLSNIDRAIYGHETAVAGPLENLRNFADERFNLKLKEVHHG